MNNNYILFIDMKFNYPKNSFIIEKSALIKL